MLNVGHLVKVDSSLEIPSDQFSFESMSPLNSVHFNYGLYPINEQGSKLDFKSMSALKTELGLKDQQIRQLGEPDRLSKNPHYKNSSPMKLYLIDRVREILDQ